MTVDLCCNIYFSLFRFVCECGFLDLDLILSENFAPSSLEDLQLQDLQCASYHYMWHIEWCKICASYFERKSEKDYFRSRDVKEGNSNLFFLCWVIALFINLFYPVMLWHAYICILIHRVFILSYLQSKKVNRDLHKAKALVFPHSNLCFLVVKNLGDLVARN